MRELGVDVAIATKETTKIEVNLTNKRQEVDVPSELIKITAFVFLLSNVLVKSGHLSQSNDNFAWLGMISLGIGICMSWLHLEYQLSIDDYPYWAK